MAATTHHDTKKLVQRLNRIEGQVGGIRKMLEADAPCDEVIIQINSARSALQKISQIVLEDHLEHCVIDALREGSREPQIESLKRAMGQYSKMV
jgi:CsoR family transcriptional regulator, copper-sensing transcriptional repressor